MKPYILICAILILSLGCVHIADSKGTTIKMGCGIIDDTEIKINP